MRVSVRKRAAGTARPQRAATAATAAACGGHTGRFDEPRSPLSPLTSRRAFELVSWSELPVLVIPVLRPGEEELSERG